MSSRNYGHATKMNTLRAVYSGKTDKMLDAIISKQTNIMRSSTATNREKQIAADHIAAAEHVLRPKSCNSSGSSCSIMGGRSKRSRRVKRSKRTRRTRR